MATIRFLDSDMFSANDDCFFSVSSMRCEYVKSREIRLSCCLRECFRVCFGLNVSGGSLQSNRFGRIERF